MRRSDCEVTDRAAINQIILRCPCCRLGLCDHGRAYIVPMSFGFTDRDGKRTFYFHSATEGRKLDLLRQNPYAGFELDAFCGAVIGETACSGTTRYQSVIGSGPVTILADRADKRAALMEIMRRNTDRSDWAIPDAALDNVCVFRLDVETLSCKQHL